jgi:hypothetical protein
MRTFVRNAAVALLLSAIAAPLMAQDIRPMSSGPQRDGFWWGVGLGAAQGTLDCDNTACDNFDKYTFPMGDIHIGFTPSPSLALGLEFTGGQKSDGFLQLGSSETETIGDVNVSAYFYPKASGNLFLQGGLSAVIWEAKVDPNWDRLVAGGLTLGAGYDFRFGRNTSFTPVLRGVFSASHALTDQDGNDPASGTKFKLSFIQLGASIIWH